MVQLSIALNTYYLYMYKRDWNEQCAPECKCACVWVRERGRKERKRERESQ